MEFRPGARHGKDLGLDIGSAGALEVDRSGNIIIIDAASSTIDVFAPGRTKPSKKVMVAGAAPLTLSLNKNETKLYVSVDVRSSFYSVRLLDYPNGTKLTHKLTDNLMDSPIAVSPDNVL
jgi:DNA-binding beta-propeller fold protein YncE